MSENKLSTLIAEIERCSYKCDAGPLENHLAFMQLKGYVEEQELMEDSVQSFDDLDIIEFIKEKASENNMFIGDQTAQFIVDTFYEFLKEKGWVEEDVNEEQI